MSLYWRIICILPGVISTVIATWSTGHTQWQQIHPLSSYKPSPIRIGLHYLLDALCEVAIQTLEHLKREHLYTHMSRRNSTDSMNNFLPFTSNDFLHLGKVLPRCILVLLQFVITFFFCLLTKYLAALVAYQIPPCFHFWTDWDGAEWRSVFKKTERRPI